MEEARLLTLGEVARTLGVTRRRVAFHALEGRLPEPVRLATGLRLWRGKDLPLIRAVLEHRVRKASRLSDRK